MAFCTECGVKISGKVKFCPECGAKVSSSEDASRKEEYVGRVNKCPNCGEIINAFEVKCKSCGYEFRDVKASSAVKEFSEELHKLEASRKPQTMMKSLVKVFGVGKQDNIDEQITNLIRNFAVPNSQEDIFEFMILAASNIDPMAHDNSNTGYSVSEREGRLLISNAWEAKYNQVFQKAQMMFPGDPRLTEIENLYKSKQKQIKGTKSKRMRIILGMVGFYAALIVLCLILDGNDEREINKIEKQLNNIVAEIQTDITNEDYDAALIKANTLHFDSSLSKTKAEDWDEQRENIIKIINEKKGK